MRASQRSLRGVHQPVTGGLGIASKIFLAFRKAGLKEEAERIFGMMLRHERFNEWYSPLTGEPKGSEQQLWTATSLLEANENFS